MLKFVKILTVIFLVFWAVYFSACSSGEYDLEEFQADYVEKTIKSDTIKNDSIKMDKKDSYTYIVQIGAFSIQENFDRFLENARQILGSEVFFEQSGNLYKIRVGRYGIRSEASRYVDFVKSKGYTDAFVITKKN